MSVVINIKRPEFWWFWSLMIYVVAAVLLYKSLADQVFDIFTHNSDWVAAAFFASEMMVLGLPIVMFTLVVWLFPRVTKYEINLPLALIQWGLVALGVFLKVISLYMPHYYWWRTRYVDYPADYFDYLRDIALTGEWFFWLGVAAFLPVLLEALVKKRPFNHKRR